MGAGLAVKAISNVWHHLSPFSILMNVSTDAKGGIVIAASHGRAVCRRVVRLTVQWKSDVLPLMSAGYEPYSSFDHPFTC